MKKTIKYISLLLILTVVISCSKTEFIETIPTIQNLKPTFKVTNITTSEGNNNLTEIKVEMDGKHQESILIPYKTTPATAEAEIDYSSVEGGLFFDGKDSIQTQIIFVEILEDDEFESQESFNIEFQLDTTVLYDTNIISITIEDNDFEFTDNDFPGYVTRRNLEGWDLIWSDEFGDLVLNENNWTPVIGNGCPQLCGFGNNEKQYYRKENISLADGLLTITANQENFQGNQYTSSRLHTKHKIFYSKGRIDFRARLPYSQGLWPALWMQGEDLNNLGWPERGEIDIMELRGSMPNIVSSTVHYKNFNGVHQFPPSKEHILDEGDFSTEFHVFSMIWNEFKVEFFVDDIRYNTIFFANLAFFINKNPFEEDFYILMNVAVGGNFGGNPDGTTTWPQKMDIDYVRIYKSE